jgi:hypothetical protein
MTKFDALYGLFAKASTINDHRSMAAGFLHDPRPAVSAATVTTAPKLRTVFCRCGGLYGATKAACGSLACLTATLPINPERDDGDAEEDERCANYEGYRQGLAEPKSRNDDAEHRHAEKAE